MEYGTFHASGEQAGEAGGKSPWRPAERPEWVRAVNEFGVELEAGGVQPAELDADSLLAQAVTTAQLSNFGDDGFLEPLHILCRALETEARLHFVGRIVAHGEILRVLVARLQLVDALERHPEIGDEKIVEPVFVCGAGRTGTTILQELLAEDPAHRTLLGWEASDPCPPRDEPEAAREARIDHWDRALSIWQRVTPETAAMHRVGGRVPAECPALFNGEFRSTYFTFSYNIPSYAAWFSKADKRPAYDYHKKFLQRLQWRRPARRWILKTATHIADVETVLEVYPDARVINTHRDPLKVLASLTGFAGTMVWMRSDHIPDLRAMMQATSTGLAALLKYTMELGSNGLLRDEILYDLRYADFMQDPLGSLARVYAHFGWEFGDQTHERMRRYLAAHPQGAHGRYVYSFDDTGLDPAVERPRFAAYQEHYGVPSEI